MRGRGKSQQLVGVRADLNKKVHFTLFTQHNRAHAHIIGQVLNTFVKEISNIIEYYNLLY